MKRAVRVGSRVSVAEIRTMTSPTGAVHRATVTELAGVEFVCRVHVSGPNLCFRAFSSEGALWCRGWRGEAVDALKAYAAMT